MARVFYVHWNKDEVLDGVDSLRAAGHKVNYHWSSGDEAWRLLKQAPPDALVISLDRLPSHGRAVAEAIRESRRLRELPIIFVGGEPEKVAVTRQKFPSATYCTPAELPKLLKKLRPFVTPGPADLLKTSSLAPQNAKRKGQTRATPTHAGKDGPPDPSQPKKSGSTAGYSGTPLPQKLGIKPNHHVALLHAPSGFDDTLGDLPSDVTVTSKLLDGRIYNVIVLFARSCYELMQRFGPAAQRLDQAGGLWISWPKKTSGVVTDPDLTEGVVRQIGLSAGLVDNKVCAVDETWSGLRFVVRVKDRAKRSRG